MGRGWNPQKPRTHMITLIYVEHHQLHELIIIFELFFFFIPFVRFPRSAPDLGTWRRFFPDKTQAWQPFWVLWGTQDSVQSPSNVRNELQLFELAFKYSQRESRGRESMK